MADIRWVYAVIRMEISPETARMVSIVHLVTAKAKPQKAIRLEEGGGGGGGGGDKMKK